MDVGFQEAIGALSSLASLEYLAIDHLTPDSIPDSGQGSPMDALKHLEIRVDRSNDQSCSRLLAILEPRNLETLRIRGSKGSTPSVEVVKALIHGIAGTVSTQTLTSLTLEVADGLRVPVYQELAERIQLRAGVRVS